MKVFWVTVAIGSVALNVVQAVTFPVRDSRAEFAHESHLTTVLLQAILDNVVANGGHTVTLPPGRFYLSAPINGTHILDGTVIQGSNPPGSTELLARDAP